MPGGVFLSGFYPTSLDYCHFSLRICLLITFVACAQFYESPSDYFFAAFYIYNIFICFACISLFYIVQITQILSTYTLDDSPLIVQGSAFWRKQV